MSDEVPGGPPEPASEVEGLRRRVAELEGQAIGHVRNERAARALAAVGREPASYPVRPCDPLPEGME